MATTTFTATLPFKMDKDGVIRVSKTRVTVDTIVAAFLEGLTAEEIAAQYPVIPLADVHSVVGYYLHQKKESGYISKTPPKTGRKGTPAERGQIQYIGHS